MSLGDYVMAHNVHSFDTGSGIVTVTLVEDLLVLEDHIGDDDRNFSFLFLSEQISPYASISHAVIKQYLVEHEDVADELNDDEFEQFLTRVDLETTGSMGQKEFLTKPLLAVLLMNEGLNNYHVVNFSSPPDRMRFGDLWVEFTIPDDDDFSEIKRILTRAVVD